MHSSTEDLFPVCCSPPLFLLQLFIVSCLQVLLFAHISSYTSTFWPRQEQIPQGWDQLHQRGNREQDSDLAINVWKVLHTFCKACPRMTANLGVFESNSSLFSEFRKGLASRGAPKRPMEKLKWMLCNGGSLCFCPRQVCKIRTCPA